LYAAPADIHHGQYAEEIGKDDGNGLASCVECGTEYKDLRHTSKSVRECARLVPVVEAQGVFLALEASGRVDDGKDEIGNKTSELDEG
jgi:hypothetical protein